MKRRKFIQTTAASAIGLPLMLNGLKVGAYPRSSILDFIDPDSDRVLVLVQLTGGNDGLHTLLPVDQYDKLANARSNIILPENSLIEVEDTVGFHPEMTGMKELYDDARLGIVQSVGYPNQNRSHFRSMDIWTSGSSAEEFVSTGWLGRHFDGFLPNYPDDYPNAEYPDPIAITIGSLVSETCQGTAANFSMALNDPNSLFELASGGDGDVPDSPYGEELSFLRESIAQTNAYTDTIQEAADKGANLSSLYPDDNRLAQQLKTVALLVSGGLKTKVYVVSIGGFDTHANQVDAADPLVGEHAQLLRTVSDAVRAFQDDLKQQGLEERVVGMTFSEFGRQIASNFSYGTDHGTAAPIMLFGSCINPGILGDNPEIPDQVEPQEGVPMQFDFRSVYGSVLMDWFELPESEVKSLLYEDFQYIPVLQPCAVVNTEERQSYFQEDIPSYNYPNPFREQTRIVFESGAEWARVSVFNPLGQEIRVLADRRFPQGEHQLLFEAHGFPPGNYYYRIQMKDRQKTRIMVKQ